MEVVAEVERVRRRSTVGGTGASGAFWKRARTQLDGVDSTLRRPCD